MAKPKFVRDGPIEVWVTRQETCHVHWRTSKGIESARMDSFIGLAQALVWLGTKMQLGEKDGQELQQ